MSLKERLKRLTGEEIKNVKPAVIDRQDQLRSLRQRIEGILNRRPAVVYPSKITGSRKDNTKLQDILSGFEEKNSFGSFFRIHSILDGTDTHGNRRLNELSDLNMDAVALLANDRRLKNLDCRDVLFLDTETTGLAGGTGTLAFLIGLGWFEFDGNFVVSQLFARNFAEEQAVLAALQDIVATKHYLITFNGKAFDVNLLSSRYILNRLNNPLISLPHLDLLHPARRLFGHRITNSRLMTLEETLLGFYRDGDLPGCEVPLRYFNWLRSHDPYLLLDVFHHNRLDITALAALTVHLAEIFNVDCNSHHYSPDDFFAVARLYLDRGEQARACSLLENLSRFGANPSTVKARQDLSLVYKRQRNWEKAVMLWKELLRENPRNLFAAEELAKWHEHGEKDTETAFQLVKKILDTVPKMEKKEKEDWQHRMCRLESRRQKRS
ncbi:MAG: hypothetical protein A4E66_02261 [Syntrophus sp. PtaB.Bin001]|nr:MAG: hypothetical protein A4E66_02261 [Syntrophus sp. PtaB.Bin001]